MMSFQGKSCPEMGRNGSIEWARKRLPMPLLPGNGLPEIHSRNGCQVAPNRQRLSY